MKVSRTDMELLNLRGQRLKCSHFQPIGESRVAAKLPCVIYLHGNSSSRLEALSCLPVLLKYNITLFCFDFSGSGHSDGEYVSLGYYERDDLAVVIEHLRQSGTVGCIGLWGRSMGAATALLHGDRDPSIAGMVLDSPFTSLRSLAEELVDVFIGVSLPKWVVSLAMNMIRSTIKGKARFDINDLSPISHVDKTYIPALFVAAEHDSFIKPDHARKLYTTYAGDKNLVIVDGDHNTARPRFFLDSVAIFFHNTLQCPEGAAPMIPETSNVSSESLVRNISESTRGQGVIMRPPDREDEDFMIQKAIEESLLHVAAETTPADSIRREKSIQ
jgi:pimeloyl-ACP methyl ester carboxylesterase